MEEALEKEEIHRQVQQVVLMDQEAVVVVGMEGVLEQVLLVAVQHVDIVEEVLDTYILHHRLQTIHRDVY